MVDSINALGSIPKVLINKTSSDETRAGEKKPEGRSVEDKVEISPQALSQQDAEKLAAKTRDDLQKNVVNLSGSRSEALRGDTV